MGVIKMICGQEGYEALTEEDKDGIVVLFDPNGDGQIRYDEFAYSFYNRRGDHESNSSVAASADGAEPYRYPYSSDPYDGPREHNYKMKKIEDSKILEGPFKGGGLQKLKVSEPASDGSEERSDDNYRSRFAPRKSLSDNNYKSSLRSSCWLLMLGSSFS